LNRRLTLIMAAISGMAVANLYYNQPLLAVMAQGFGVPDRQVGAIPMLSQIGYALGLLFVVPLGDLLERRRLIVVLLGAVAVALVAAAVAPGVAWLGAASLLIGFATVVPQLVLPFAALLAPPKERGRVVGTVMGGLLVGILLARTVSGWVGAGLGWRAMYWIAAGLMVLLMPVALALLPQSRPARALSYRELLPSLLRLVREQPVLREAALLGAMAFGAFSAFWSTLVFLLKTPPYHYGSQVAGLFGLVGLVGALAAPVVGRLADRRSPRAVVGLALGITAAAFAVLWAFGWHLWGLALGVVLLDLGVQGAQISNQARIYALVPEAPSRVNTVYMFAYFLGGALGSILGATAWGTAGWTGVCILGLGFLAAGLAVYAARGVQAADTPAAGG
jgi:predicted MFS family arabinose efflux permease